jgi:hypothetical protein
LALIDALMRAYVLAVVKIPHVMRVVRYVCNSEPHTQAYPVCLHLVIIAHLTALHAV